MLDSLGSTLSHETVNSFWTRFNKQSRTDVLTINEAIQCLETELFRPASEKKRIDPEDSAMDTSAPVTPAITSGMEVQQALNFDKLDFSGIPSNPAAMGRDHQEDATRLPNAPRAQPTEPMQQPLVDAALTPGHPGLSPSPGPGSFVRNSSTSSSDAEDSSGSSSPDGSVERVINVKNCPLCHRPRLNSKAEVDIVTHLAVCASQDWARMDRIVVGNYVTASQAQRKWYTKVISKVSSGNYKLGAVRLFRCAMARGILTGVVRAELGEHHRAKPHDRAARGGEDGGLRPAGYPSAVQGDYHLARAVRGRLMPLYRAGRAGWRADEVGLTVR